MSHAPQRRWFGTDGIRAPFGEAPLDRATVRALGRALGERLAAAADGSPPSVVVGGDTRASTPTLCRWLIDGLATHGVGVRFVGVLPTPGIAWLVRHLGTAAGIVVSASHNPARDNGIKLIDHRGLKWPLADEAAIEGSMTRWLDARDTAGADRSDLPATDTAAVGAYLDALAATVRGDAPLAGLRLAIDTANGASSAFAAPLFRRLGATVDVIADAPDGSNINHRCGSTHPEAVAALTHRAGADLGVAFDGDADRAILIDEQGIVRDGDAILYLWARDLAASDALPGRTVVATSMSNLGLEEALARVGIGLVRTGVGDRAVVERLLAEGWVLGGEQSGHIVNLALATTGDGLLTALQLAALRRRAGRPLSALLEGFTRFPQLIENVAVRTKPDLASLPAVEATRSDVATALGTNGRLVLRYSGTEPLARIMIEGRDEQSIRAHANRLAAAIRGAIGT